MSKLLQIQEFDLVAHLLRYFVDWVGSQASFVAGRTSSIPSDVDSLVKDWILQESSIVRAQKHAPLWELAVCVRPADLFREVVSFLNDVVSLSAICATNERVACATLLRGGCLVVECDVAFETLCAVRTQLDSRKWIEVVLLACAWLVHLDRLIDAASFILEVCHLFQGFDFASLV